MISSIKVSIITLALVGLLSNNGNAQEILDNPEERIPKLNINFACNVEAINSNTQYYNLGACGYIGMSKKSAIYFSFNKSIYADFANLAVIGNTGNVNVQVLHINSIAEGLKQTKRKFDTLSIRKKINFIPTSKLGKKYIFVSFKRFQQIGLRKGLGYQHFGLQYDITPVAPANLRSDFAKNTMMYIMGGVQYRKIFNKIVRLPNHNFNTVISYCREYYLDGKIGMYNSMYNLIGNKLTKMEGSPYNMPFGFSIGSIYYKVAPYKETKDWLPYFLKSECGLKAYYGFYAELSIGLTLVKKSW